MNRKLPNFFTFTLLASLAMGMASSAHADGDGLGLSPTLNLLTFGNMFVPSADVQGQVAVGGNASIANYSINTLTATQPLYPGTGLTVGGNLDFAGGAIMGNTVVGGNISTGLGSSFGGNVQVAGNFNTNGNWVTAATNNWTTPATISYGGILSGVTSGQNPMPVKVAPSSVQLGINFAAEQQRLTSLSQSFDALANTGSSYMDWSTLALNANNAAVAVFDLSGSDVVNNMRLDNLGANTTVILNVHGQSVDFSAMGYTNFAPGHVLFNLPEATQITFTSGVNASFLAPLASFTSAGGNINGQVVVGSWSGSAQINDAAFIGNVAAVPEPETYAMMLAGLMAVGLIARRRRSPLGAISFA